MIAARSQGHLCIDWDRGGFQFKPVKDFDYMRKILYLDWFPNILRFEVSGLCPARAGTYFMQHQYQMLLEDIILPEVIKHIGPKVKNWRITVYVLSHISYSSLSHYWLMSSIVTPFKNSREYAAVWKPPKDQKLLGDTWQSWSDLAFDERWLNLCFYCSCKQVS